MLRIRSLSVGRLWLARLVPLHLESRGGLQVTSILDRPDFGETNPPPRSEEFWRNKPTWRCSLLPPLRVAIGEGGRLLQQTLHRGKDPTLPSPKTGREKKDRLPRAFCKSEAQQPATRFWRNKPTEQWMQNKPTATAPAILAKQTHRTEPRNFGETNPREAATRSSPSPSNRIRLLPNSTCLAPKSGRPDFGRRAGWGLFRALPYTGDGRSARHRPGQAGDHAPFEVLP
jgi:hypothetical protein